MILALRTLCVFASVALTLDAQKPERLVNGSTITSKASPRVRIRLPHHAKYLGANRWVLYDVADCEVHVFVEADKHKVVQRLYWIQFEAYLPSRPELKYDYSSNPIQKISGLAFHVRARFGPTDDSVKAGSDTEHVRRMIAARGYKMPAGMMNVRLVHLGDPRRELMIIYAENTAAAGVAWNDLQPGGQAAERWADIQKSLLEHATKRILVHAPEN